MAMHITMGSYNKRDQKVLKLTLLQVFGGACVSIIAGFMVFGTLGFMAGEQGATIDQVVRGGSGLTFIAYPTALSMMPYARIWAVVFFIMLFMLGVDGEFAILESIITAFCDWHNSRNPHQTAEQKKRYHRIVLLTTCFTTYLGGLTMITSNGMFVFNWLDHYGASGVCMISIGLCQCLALAWTYGSERYWEELQELMGLESSWLRYFPICWKYVTPVTTISVLLLFMKDGMPKLSTTLNYDSKFESEYPVWSHALGYVLMCSSIIWIPVYALKHWWCERHADYTPCKASPTSSTQSIVSV